MLSHPSLTHWCWSVYLEWLPSSFLLQSSFFFGVPFIHCPLHVLQWLPCLFSGNASAFHCLPQWGRINDLVPASLFWDFASICGGPPEPGNLRPGLPESPWVSRRPTLLMQYAAAQGSSGNCYGFPSQQHHDLCWKSLECSFPLECFCYCVNPGVCSKSSC